MAKNYSKIINFVLKEIKPKPEIRRKLLTLSRKALNLTKKFAKKYKAKAILAGSITRDTWLPDKKEIDVFILFPEKMKEKRMEELGLKVGKAVIDKLKGKFVIEYAEHPYVCGTVDDIDIDIVPCFELKTLEKIKSAVDRTPFHVKYIEKKLPLSMSNQVRLLKQFLKANGMYGADAKTEGFSGYVCELLTIKYRKFLDILKAAIKWKAGEVIDIEKFYPEKDLPKVGKQFKGQPLILLDPTDKNRNTVAALSVYNFFKFKKCAKEFLEKPSTDLFFEKQLRPLTESELIQLLMSRRTELIIVKFLPPKVVPDILWPQLRKFAERLQNILEERKYEFKVLGRDVFTDEQYIAVALLEMEVSKLPFVQKREGPLFFDLQDSQNFISKYSSEALAGPYIEGNKWIVEIKRDFLTARDKLQDSLSKPLDVLKAKGMPNYIAERLVKGFEIISETSRIMQIVERNPDFGIFLRKYFEKERLV